MSEREEIEEALAAVQERWEHGHDELTDGCALCVAEYDDAFRTFHGLIQGP